MIGTAFRQIVFWTLLCGLIYPVLMTGLCQLLMPRQANGSLLSTGQGSELVGQQFTDPGSFWGRPSAVNYNAASSGASNFGPNEPKLQEARAAALERFKGQPPPPRELLTASGSGLDPHISPAAAEYQVSRVARERGLDEASVRALIVRFTEQPTLGFLGAPRVNYVLLNQELDRLSPRKGAGGGPVPLRK